MVLNPQKFKRIKTGQEVKLSIIRNKKREITPSVIKVSDKNITS
ncbi:hypothetical protein P789_0452 [Enterococcus faecalis MTmid8]|nr:hypothetical protein P789_0452 [Enterococcus faecalis MTmid8]